MAEGGEFELSLYFSDHYLIEIASPFCTDILAFQQGEESLCPSSYSERNVEPYIHFFMLRVCNFTSPSKRDIEPAVQLHSKKELPLLRSENSGTSGGQSR